MARVEVREDAKPIRTFLAIPISKLFGRQIGSYLKQLRDQTSDVRWISPESVHITLHFFGPTVGQEMETIQKVIPVCLENQAPFKIQMKGIDAFPDSSRPRIIWMGVDGQCDELIGMRERMETALMDAGFMSETRTYNPHATIGRVKRSARFREKEFKNLSSFDETEFVEIQEIALFCSRLSAEGARYEILEKFPFPK